MAKLGEMTCEACRRDSPLASESEVAQWLPQIPDWEISNVEGIDRLTRIFTFKNFARALDFTNKIGILAEEIGHHPAILTEYGKVSISWWTHKIRGLHQTDFILAARTDDLFDKAPEE